MKKFATEAGKGKGGNHSPPWFLFRGGTNKEYSGEEGILEDVKNEKGNITKI